MRAYDMPTIRKLPKLSRREKPLSPYIIRSGEEVSEPLPFLQEIGGRSQCGRSCIVECNGPARLNYGRVCPRAQDHGTGTVDAPDGVQMSAEIRLRQLVARRRCTLKTAVVTIARQHIVIEKADEVHREPALACLMSLIYALSFGWPQTADSWPAVSIGSPLPLAIA